MPDKKVIQLGGVREMLAHLDAVRERILSGRTKGIHTTILDDEQGETVIATGVYRKDPQKAINAILSASVGRMLSEDEPPLFQAGRM